MSRAWLLGNALWLQLGWWGCVLGAIWGWLLALVAVGLFVHIALCRRPGEELAVLLKVALAGCLLDAALGALGVFEFARGGPLPLWLALLWLVFASGMRHSLAWATRPAWRAALLGSVGGPLAYCAGAPLAGVTLPFGVAGTAALLAPIWAVALPLMLRLANRPRLHRHGTD